MALRLCRKQVLGVCIAGGFAELPELVILTRCGVSTVSLGLVRWVGPVDHEEVAVACGTDWTQPRTFISQTCCSWNPG